MDYLNDIGWNNNYSIHSLLIRRHSIFFSRITSKCLLNLDFSPLNEFMTKVYNNINWDITVCTTGAVYLF